MLFFRFCSKFFFPFFLDFKTYFAAKGKISLCSSASRRKNSNSPPYEGERTDQKFHKKFPDARRKSISGGVSYWPLPSPPINVGKPARSSARFLFQNQHWWGRGRQNQAKSSTFDCFSHRPYKAYVLLDFSDPIKNLPIVDLAWVDGGPAFSTFEWLNILNACSTLKKWEGWVGLPSWKSSLCGFKCDTHDRFS